MMANYEVPSHAELLSEQERAQADKFQGRVLAEYSQYMFPGQLGWREPRGSAVVDFVRPMIGEAEPATLEGVLEGLADAKNGQSIHWVDMGGGRGLAMRQLGSSPDVRSKISMTNVDLFDYGLNGLEQNELDYLSELAPGMVEPDAAPRLLQANVETVRLPESPDLITSVESIQYLHNPLQAVANWYNQLTDNGIMIIASSTDWSSWVRYQREPSSSEWDETPCKHLLEALDKASVNYAATYTSDWPNEIRPDHLYENHFKILAVQKKPGTSFTINKPVVKVWTNPWDYKAVYYEAPVAGDPPIVEVVKQKAYTSLGAVSLENAQ